MSSPVEKYIASHSGPVHPGLEWIEAATNIRTNYPRMMCGRTEGRLLTLLTQISGARKALEIGTFTGYSAACIALGLPDDGHLDTLESDDELEDIIREGWLRCGVSDRITLHLGDALSTIGGLAGPYDFVFIDADKREYVDYYEAVIPLLRPGGLIIADDVLLGGKPCDANFHDAKTLALRTFNDHVAADPRTEMLMLPIRDGISIIRKK